MIQVHVHSLAWGFESPLEHLVFSRNFLKSCGFIIFYKKGSTPKRVDFNERRRIEGSTPKVVE